MNIYRALYQSRVATALGAARAARGLTHKGLKGEIVEILIRELFTPLLPPNVGVATGQIVDSFSDKQSTQQDIILYDRSILPPILYEGAKGVIPIESVLYTIEVKSVLNASGLRTAHNAAKSLREFRYRPGYFDTRGEGVEHRVNYPISVVFAMDSDLSGKRKTEVERYRTIYDVDGFPFIGVICIAGNSYWWEEHGRWRNIPGTTGFDETVSFVGGVSNTYKNVARTRGNPNLGYYLGEPNDQYASIPSGTVPTIDVGCDECGNKQWIYFTDLNDQYCDYPNGFIGPDRCRKCGGNLRAPSGRYENQRGLLVRIGECDK